MSRSIASGGIPACLIAAVPASIASEAVVSVGAATCRSRMPVRSTIHASVVSTRCSISAFVTSFSGTAVPQPPTQARTLRDSQPGDGLALTETLAVVGEETGEDASEGAADGGRDSRPFDHAHSLPRNDALTTCDVVAEQRTEHA